MARDDPFGIGERGALLVRPDHVIAWRADDHGPDAAGRLSGAVWGALTRRSA